MVKGYRYYLKSKSIADTAHFLRCSYSNVRMFITELQKVLAGGEPKRLHGRQNILDVVYTLQRFPAETEEVRPITPSMVVPMEDGRLVSSHLNAILGKTKETPEKKMNRLFEEFKTAVSDWSYELVEEKNKELVETAKRSNIVDFLKRGMSRQQICVGM